MVIPPKRFLISFMAKSGGEALSGAPHQRGDGSELGRNKLTSSLDGAA